MRLGTRRWTANAPCPRVQVDCKTHDARICDVIDIKRCCCPKCHCPSVAKSALGVSWPGSPLAPRPPRARRRCRSWQQAAARSRQRMHTQIRKSSERVLFTNISIQEAQSVRCRVASVAKAVYVRAPSRSACDFNVAREERMRVRSRPIQVQSIRHVHVKKGAPSARLSNVGSTHSWQSSAYELQPTTADRGGAGTQES